MTDGKVDRDTEIRLFCENVGELVLWASALDAQLTKAVIRACPLTESTMLEPVVAELDARAKVEIIRARSKYVTSAAWSKGIKKWVDQAEKVNGYRNIVAHHQVSVSDGNLVLYSVQARKLLKRITASKLAPAMTIDDIKRWVEEARNAHRQGQNVLANLDRFAKEVAKHRAK